MRDYGKVFSTFWTSDSTRGLSDDAKVLALYLLTGPHSNIIGCYRLPDGYVSEDLGWTAQRVSEGFGELFRKGFATRDEASKWVFIHKHLKWNPLENPNQIVGALKLYDQIPDTSSVKPLIARAFREYTKPDLKGYETLPKPFPNPSETVSKPETETEAETRTEAEETSLQGSAEKDNRARASDDPSGDGICSASNSPGLEFLELRQFFDEHIRPEGAESGFIEFKQLRASREWPGSDVICDSILEYARSCLRPEDRQYIPGLGKFLREKYWKRKPQPRASPPETQRQIAAALIAEDDRRNMHGHAQRDQNGSCQVEYRALPPP